MTLNKYTGKGPNGQLRFRTSLHNTIYDVAKGRCWKETDSETDWDLHWADVHWIREVFDHVHLEDNQRVNHFRNHYELTRKDLTVKNLKRMKKSLEREDKVEEAAKYDFFPGTFVLPAEYGLFQEEFKKAAAVWIMKPIAKAQGKGIFLFNKLSQISDWKKDHRWRQDSPQAETYIVQKYVDNPHLVGGKKYDLRVYVLVTSYSPLVVWLHRTGFARFSHHRFSMNVKEIDNNFIHLTNVAVQKTSNNYIATQGCKWSIRQLKLLMMSKYGPQPVDAVFSDIQGLIIRSLLSVQKIMINDKHCFEMYGYDILIDNNLKSWLLEVNASPSLSAETSADYEMKYNLLEDSMNVLDLEKKCTGNEERMGGYDLIYKGVPVKLADNYCWSTNLGARNEKAIPRHKINKPPHMKKETSERSLI
eukprot:TRINITY_DN10312_c0_g1_i1.p1 TRINITY_DN10312_c0_g1~~TRINITY_DN10312_c0_g1_i1.p1  ORF type:complete len:418 (+),score=41.95 TRINITY_DN10312_c0_g1_i1:44-1297(+)